MEKKIFTISNILSAIVGLITAIGALFTAISQFPGFQNYAARYILSGNDSVGLIAVFSKSNNFISSEKGRMKDFIEKSDKEIWFSGTTFYISIQHYQADILKKFRSCVDINVVTLNPSTENLDLIARAMGYEDKILRLMIEENIKALAELQREANKTRACSKISIRLTTRQFTSRIYMFDPKDRSGVTYVVPQIHGKDSTSLPGFLLSNEEGYFNRDYLDGIRNLANDKLSVSLEEWLAKNPNFIDENNR